MSVENEPNPNGKPERDFATLQGCFVEGSAEQLARERRIRRRALIISVAIQAAILTAIILVPLFGKPERIAFAYAVPIPPYYHRSAPERRETQPRTPNQHKTGISDPLLPPNHIPEHIVERSDEAPAEPPAFPTGNGPAVPCQACIGIEDSRSQPTRPAELRPQPPKRLAMDHLEPAMLIRRIEPLYPPLAKQLHREGRVELHAIIATDGSIQSLQVVSGDLIFVQYTLDAVRQWRYRPTVLNGQPVEIDTYITVVFTLQR